MSCASMYGYIADTGPRRITVGLSLSSCIKEYLEGNSLPALIYSSTMCTSRENFVNVCERYKTHHWQDCDRIMMPREGVRAAVDMWDAGRLIQPRVLGFNEGFGRVRGGYLNEGHELHPWGDSYIYEDEIPGFIGYLLRDGQLRFSSENISRVVEDGLLKERAEHNIVREKHNTLRANYASLQEAYNDMRHGQTRLQALVEKRTREVDGLRTGLNNAIRVRDAAYSALNTLDSAYNTLKVNHETLKEEFAQVKASRNFIAILRDQSISAWEASQAELKETRAALKSAQEAIAEENKKVSVLQVDTHVLKRMIGILQNGSPVAPAIRDYRKLQEEHAELKEAYTKVCKHNAVLVSNAENNKGVLREYNRELQKARKELDTTVEALKSSRDRLSRYYMKYGIDL